MHRLKKISQKIQVSEEEVIRVLGVIKGGEFHKNFIKKTMQESLIIFGALCLFYIFEESWLMLLGAVFLPPSYFIYKNHSLIKVIKLKQQTEWHKKLPALIRMIILSIYSGQPIHVAMQNALSDLSENNYLSDMVTTALQSMIQGGNLKTALTPLSLKSKMNEVSKLVSLVSNYEETGNELVLHHLEELLTVINESNQQRFIRKLNAGDLLSVLPVMINFIMLMILLMSPIFLGGLG